MPRLSAVPASSLPPEIALEIIHEACKIAAIPVTPDPEEARVLTRNRRKQRLEQFRNLARVCRNWLDPARVVYWAEVTLVTLPEIIAFADALGGPSSKPTCIRSVSFFMLDYLQYAPMKMHTEEIVAKVLDVFPSILRALPKDLFRFEMDCISHGRLPWTIIIYDCLRSASQSEAGSITNVTSLIIGPRPDTRQFFDALSFARNVTHLALTISNLDDATTFSLPCPSWRLESFDLNLTYKGGGLDSLARPIAEAIQKTLAPACSNLKSLNIEIQGRHIRDFRHSSSLLGLMLSLSHTSLTHLCIRAVQIFPKSLELPLRLPNGDFAAVLLTAQIQCCLALQHLELHNVGLHLKMFHQLRCKELRYLEVTGGYPDMRFETDLVAILDSPELSQLKNLVINFGKGTTRKAWWLMLQGKCTSRGIRLSH